MIKHYKVTITYTDRHQNTVIVREDKLDALELSLERAELETAVRT